MKRETREPNHLIHEKSPYLLQHAHNPVDWYPWGEEAFAKAKKEDKPIFLSIGYSTCHWCHVMEKESFEDDEVAEALNWDFVAIKVDKEERPDVDAVYMAVCQAMTSQGGWPLTILMTPEQKPFFAGTYFPKHSRYPMFGVMELLENVKMQWKTDKNRLLESSEEITKQVQEHNEITFADGAVSFELIEQAVSLFQKNFDKTYGGFHRAPKFPTPHNLMFLMRYYQQTKDKLSLDMVEKTLSQMYRGGIFDHVGFGFYRYSTDEKWLVPHFEKMLYDNALLIIAYLEAYQITNNELYKLVAEKTLHYVMRELMSSEGGYFCAQDADSDGIEGKYYVFTPQEVNSVLGPKDGEIFNKQFGITQKGNFEERNIPNLIGSDIDYSQEDMKPLFDKLYEFRKDRTTLHKDDKILTSWNALMIVALAKAYCVFKNEKYLQSAQFAVKCIELFLTKDGQLQTSYREGKTSGPALLDDYAFLGWAYLELYQATYQAKWLEKAIETATKIDAFWDEKQGGFFLSGKENETLIMRVKEFYDGAMPSGNSVAAYVLVLLAKLTGEISWLTLADKQLAFGASTVKLYPAGYSFFNIAMMTQISPSKELVCVVADESEIKEIQELLQKSFMPNLFVIIKTQENTALLDKLVPFIKEYRLENNQTTFYLCQNNACSAPFHGIETLIEKLAQ